MFLLFFIPFFLLFFRFIPVRFLARTHRVSDLASLWRGDLVDDKRWKIVSRCLVIVSNDEQQGRSSLSSRRRNWFWIYSPESGETIRFCFRDESSVSIPRHDPSTVRYFYTLLSLLPENWTEKRFSRFSPRRLLSNASLTHPAMDSQLRFPYVWRGNDTDER